MVRAQRRAVAYNFEVETPLGNNGTDSSRQIQTYGFIFKLQFSYNLFQQICLILTSNGRQKSQNGQTGWKTIKDQSSSNQNSQTGDHTFSPPLSSDPRKKEHLPEFCEKNNFFVIK